LHPDTERHSHVDVNKIIQYRGHPWVIVLLLASIGVQSGCTAVPADSDDSDVRSRTTKSSPTQNGVLACTSVSRWLKSLPRDPRTYYGVGSAAIGYEPLSHAIKRASDSARSEILKQITVVVSSETEISSRRDRNDYGSRFSSSIREAISAEAPEMELAGMAIQEQCVDWARQTVYALATLDRKRAVENLRNERSRLDKEMADLASVPGDIPRTEQLRRLLPALSLIDRHDALTESLNRIADSPPPPSPVKDSLETRINTLLEELTVALKPRGSQASEISRYLSVDLADMGIRVLPESPADLVLEYTLDTRDASQGGMYFVFADARVSVRDVNGRLVNAVESRIKEGSPISAEHARKKAVEEVGKELGSVLSSTLLTKL